MVTVSATVQGGSIKLPEAMRLANGTRVIITILAPVVKNGKRFLPEDIEAEDLEFVRACRGRLAKQLEKVE